MTQTPHADPGLICPLHKQDVAEVCHTCPFWTHLRGANPQTGEQMDDWKCAITFLPILLIENAQQMRQASAAVESTRNVLMRGFNGRMLEQ